MGNKTHIFNRFPCVDPRAESTGRTRGSGEKNLVNQDDPTRDMTCISRVIAWWVVSCRVVSCCVVSGQEVFNLSRVRSEALNSHGSGRVESEGFEIPPVGSGRVGSSQKVL